MEELIVSNNNSRLFTPPTSPSSPAVGPTPSPAEQATAVLLSLCCVLGVPGNVAVLVALLRKLERNNFTQLLMLNLACCDLVCLITVPVWIVEMLRQQELNYLLCKSCSFLVYWSLYSNIYTITLMSIQRFVNVLHRHRWARIGQKGERALIVGLWGVSFLMAWPSIIPTGRIKDGHFICSRPPRMEGQALASAVLELLLGFIVPFSVMISFYVCLYRKVKETALSSNKRTSQLISRIIITFLVLWVPAHIVGIVGIVGGSLRTSQPAVAYKLECFTDDFAVRIVHVFPLFSSVIDPILYAFSFRNILPWNKERQTEDAVVQTTVVSC